MSEGVGVSGAAHGSGHLDLLPVGPDGRAPLATHTAVRDGDWFDPATWGGEVPGAGAIVHIPAGRRVDYDGASEAGLFILRLDGALTITARDGGATQLVADTIVTSRGSDFVVDAGGATDGTVDIVFAEGRPARHAAHFADASAGDGVLGRTAWDPEQLSLGLVAEGTVRVTGQALDGHLALSEGVRAGADTLTFAAAEGAGQGWAAGQTLVIGATDHVDITGDGAFRSEDELRTIAAVEHRDGTMIVTLDRPLDHDHVGPTDPRTGAEIPGHVGNLSRNVTFSSAAADRNGDGVVDPALSNGSRAGADQHVAGERGHVMFMHNDDVVVENSAFFGLGRTDKSRPIDDFVLTEGQGHRVHADEGASGLFDPGLDTPLQTPAEEVTNARGRYALHIHMAGVEHDCDEGAGRPGPCPVTGGAVCHCHETGGTEGDGARIEGNAVWGSPGWGIVQHESVADLIGNVTYDIRGTAITTETGNETGRWIGNATFRTEGFDRRNAADDAAVFNEDFGGDGVGYWFAGRGIDVIDNVAVSSERTGFFYSVLGSNPSRTPTAALGEAAAAFAGLDGAPNEDVPIAVFEGNRVQGAYEGIRIVTDPLDSVRKFNDAWSIMTDFVATEVVESGVSITYSSKYFFENFLILGTEEKPAGTASAGFFMKASVADITIADSHIEGFQNAVTNWVQVGDRQEYRRGYWDPGAPLDHASVPGYGGLGEAFGIANPAHNLWNLTLIDVTQADIAGAAKFRAPVLDIATPDGGTERHDPLRIIHTGDANTADDPDRAAGVTVELVDDSAAGGLVALWREDIAEHPDQARMLAEHIPLTYGDAAYLGQIHFEGGGQAKRRHFLDYEPGINADRWSGTVLEFAKEDSLGRYVFAYDDFSPLDWSAARRAVSTNERLVISREQIDGLLMATGSYTAPGAGGMRFVEVPVLLTDRGTGEWHLRYFLVGLDRAWEVPPGTRDLGDYVPHAASVVASVYQVFENGDPVPGATVEPGFVLVEAGAGPDAPPPVDGSAGRDVVKLGDTADRVALGDGHDVALTRGGDDMVEGGAGRDVVKSGDGDDVVHAGEGDDVVLSGHGTDRIFGGAGADVLKTGHGDDLADGGAGDDILVGFRGGESLIGGDGDDILRAGLDDDVLQGGAGDDRLVPGPGRDRLVYREDDFGTDKIFGFRPGSDRIDFRGSGLGALEDIAIVELPGVGGYAAVTRVETEAGTLLLYDVQGLADAADTVLLF